MPFHPIHKPHRRGRLERLFDRILKNALAVRADDISQRLRNLVAAQEPHFHFRARCHASSRGGSN